MAMTVSYVPNGIDGSQCAYQCLTTDKEICVGKMSWNFYQNSPQIAKYLKDF